MTKGDLVMTKDEPIIRYGTNETWAWHPDTEEVRFTVWDDISNRNQSDEYISIITRTSGFFARARNDILKKKDKKKRPLAEPPLLSARGGSAKGW